MNATVGAKTAEQGLLKYKQVNVKFSYTFPQSVSLIWASSISPWWFGFRLKSILNTAPAASKNTD